MIFCVFCDAVAAVHISYHYQEIPLLGGPTLRVAVPVHECDACGHMWMEEEAEAIRDKAIKDALGEGNDQY